MEQNMENEMEAILGYMGIMEKKMETTGIIGIIMENQMEKKMEKKMENQMETPRSL